MHHLQRIRLNNFQLVKTTIARSMPNGIDDKKLRSILMLKFGFSKFKTMEYVTILEESSIIEKSNGVWRMVVHKKEETANQTEEPVESEV